jgi:ParB family transcriptional regulator, chromosome partitioning protein
MPAPPTAKRIEMWPLDRLVPYERNARTHSAEQVAQIAASIQEFGFTNPLLVDGADGILAGHGRLAAAKDMGLAEVPVIVLDHLSAAQRRAYILADNQLALNAGWDMELLQQEIVGLNLADFDLSLLGFDEDRIAGLLEGGADVQELEEMPTLPSGDREPFQQMTFTLHDDQAEIIKEAVQKAKDMGPFADTVNENSNGNGLSRVAELFLSWGSDHGIG